jgi:drug/metabolite transporter (DMT)-like permease
VTTILLGLAAGVSWGFADFFGGFASRRMSAAAVAAVSQIIGILVVAACLVATRPSLPAWSDLGLGALGGVCGGLGVFAFYRALAVGTISLVAPVSALGAGIPVAVGLLQGERPGRLALVGAFVALVGAVVASRAPGRATRRGLGMAVLAAVGFGLFFVLITPAAETSVLWAAFATRTASVPLLLAICLGFGVSLRVGRGLGPFVVGSGVLDVVANIAFAAAAAAGPLAIASVLAGLYPVATVVLAQIVLHERLSGGQTAGVAAALAGVGLIVAG